MLNTTYYENDYYYLIVIVFCFLLSSLVFRRIVQKYYHNELDKMEMSRHRILFLNFYSTRIILLNIVIMYHWSKTIYNFYGVLKDMPLSVIVFSPWSAPLYHFLFSNLFICIFTLSYWSEWWDCFLYSYCLGWKNQLAETTAAAEI